MRQITKDITLKQGGQDLSFRLSKLDAFSGVSLLRLLMRLEEREGEHTILDLVASLSEEELRSVMTSVLNHVFWRTCPKLRCTECNYVFVTDKRPQSIPGCPKCGGKLEIIGAVDAKPEDIDY